MEKVKLMGLLLGSINAFIWFGFQPGPPTMTPKKMREHINKLQNEIPGLEETATWIARIQPTLAPAPSGNAKMFLQEVDAVAKVAGVTIADCRGLGGEPAAFDISGYGSYEAIATLMNNLENRLYVLTEQASLEKQVDGNIRWATTLRVRNGPWQGGWAGEQRPKPYDNRLKTVSLGKINLFEATEQYTPVVSHRPQIQIRFLGHFEENNQHTLILEVDQKPCVVSLHEKFSKNLEVVNIENNVARIREPSGKERLIPMEQPH